MRDARSDYLEYINSIEDPEERAYLKRFYQDFYQGHHVREGAVITDKDMKKEATRNLHYYESEVFYQKDALQHLPEDYDDFMTAASDEWDWQNALKIQGYDAALELITEHALRDLKNTELDHTFILTRYYEQRDRLRRMENREKREKKTPLKDDDNE